ncbi:ribosome-associated translation inhibitor RaiA [bacterium]|nr:ribosome-associated translation inhibitor RaiA [bacterium]
MEMKKSNQTRLLLKGLKIDSRAKDYIEKRLQAVRKMLDDILRVEIEIDLDKKGKFRVEVMIKTPRKLYRAEETTESVEGSIDLVAEQLKVQIRRSKDKIVALKKRGGRSIKKKATIDEDARF